MDVINFLHKNWLLNAPVIEMLQKGEATVLEAGDFGVACMHKEGLLLLNLTADEEIVRFKDKISSGILTVFYGAQDNDKIRALIPDVTRLIGCYQMVYTKKEPPLIDPAVNKKIEFKPLDESYAQFMWESYNRKQTVEHLAGILRRGLMYGAFLDGKITGFVGRHSEGSMGYLVVLPQYRRMGIGRALESFIIKVVMDEGRVPYGHVELPNTISFSLQKSYDGIEFADKMVDWISCKK